MTTKKDSSGNPTIPPDFLFPDIPDEEIEGKDYSDYIGFVDDQQDVEEHDKGHDDESEELEEDVEEDDDVEDDDVGEDHAVVFQKKQFIDLYPEAQLLHLHVNEEGASTEAEQEDEVLKDMKFQDDTFKKLLHDDPALQSVYIQIYKGVSAQKYVQEDGSPNKQLQTIQDGLVNHAFFVVRQRRLVTRLHREGSLVGRSLAWMRATDELKVVAKIVSRWNTSRMYQYAQALDFEGGCSMDDSEFDSELRSLFL